MKVVFLFINLFLFKNNRLKTAPNASLIRHIFIFLFFLFFFFFIKQHILSTFIHREILFRNAFLTCYIVLYEKCICSITWRLCFVYKTFIWYIFVNILFCKFDLQIISTSMSKLLVYSLCFVFYVNFITHCIQV